MELLARHAAARDRLADSVPPTSAVLDRLGGSWQRIDDIRWPGRSFANIDHVLIGPPGVFVIDTQGRAGASVFGSEKTGNGGRGRQDSLDGVAIAAHAVGSLAGLIDRRPTPVICLLRPTRSEGVIDKVVVCSLATVIPRLQAMTPILGAVQVGDIADKLRKELGPVTGQLAVVPRQRRGSSTTAASEQIALSAAKPSTPTKGRALPMAVAAVVAASGMTYAAFHIDDIMPGSGSTQHHHPAGHAKPGKNG
jgi:hypothetical protein